MDRLRLNAAGLLPGCIAIITALAPKSGLCYNESNLERKKERFAKLEKIVIGL